jgi:hypothetical protein
MRGSPLPSLVLGCLSLAVSAVAMVGAAYQPEDAVFVRSPQAGPAELAPVEAPGQ